jgi:hypothetical protein
MVCAPELELSPASAGSARGDEVLDVAYRDPRQVWYTAADAEGNPIGKMNR